MKEIVACCDGVIIELRQVNDPIFSQRLTGEGIAIRPEKGRIVAPCDGVIRLAFKGKHSFVIENEDGINIMVHIGINTINLMGEGFTGDLKKGQKVKTGELLMEVDLDFMKSKKIDLTTVMVFMDSRQIEDVDLVTSGYAQAGQTTVMKYTL